MNAKLTKTGRLPVAILAASTAAWAIGCERSGEEDVASSEGEITTGGQLDGSDMPPGRYALTFDDGPGPRTEELANWLGDRAIQATFFINGRNVPGRESALAAIKARGHLLANHTQNHVDMRSLSGDALYRAVADTDAIIARYQPEGPWLLRAPYGSWDARVSRELNATDMSKYVGAIFWNIGGALTTSTAADWACWSYGLGVADCADRYITEMATRGRGIILMHDVHSKTVDMVKLIVERVGAVAFVPITSAQRIEASIVVSQGHDGTPPPPPSPESGCGDVDYAGRCDKNTLMWCEDGVRKTVDCATRGKVCSWKNDAEGHDCVTPAPCGDVTYEGSCDGDMLTWCDESGALRKVSCTAKGRRCALQNEATGYNCVP